MMFFALGAMLPVLALAAIARALTRAAVGTRALTPALYAGSYAISGALCTAMMAVTAEDRDIGFDKGVTFYAVPALLCAVATLAAKFDNSKS